MSKKTRYWTMCGLIVSALVATVGQRWFDLRPAHQWPSRADPTETVASVRPAAPADHQRASELLARLGRLAAQVDVVQPRADQLIHVTTERFAVSVRRVHQVWLDPDGMIPMRIESAGGGDDFVWPEKGREAERDRAVGKARSVLAARGPSATRPTITWCSTLPRDPAALLELVRNAAAADGSGNLDLTVVEVFQHLLGPAWPLIAKDRRESLFNALALAPGVGAAAIEPTSVGGRLVYVVTIVGGEDSTDLLFDQSSGVVVGIRVGPMVWEYSSTAVVEGASIG